MRLFRKHRNRYSFRSLTALLCACLIYTQLLQGGFTLVLAQDTPKDADKKDPAEKTDSKPESANAAAETPSTNKPAEPANKDAKGKEDAKTKEARGKSEDIEVSFQGANIDMIVQWLAQQTGKSVVKHPQVQCQLTIVSSKKMKPREAIDLVYRALELEGFTAIESSKSILIVPEGKEPKMSPELLDSSRTDIPAGREKLIKIFPLKFAQAADIKAKISGLLSEKGTADTEDRANQIIVTDYTENIALVAHMIKALDTDTPGDMAVRVIPLKNVSAQDLVKDVGALYQKMAGKSASPKEMVEISANDRSNSLIVMSSEANFKALQRVVAELDTEEAQEKVMQAFTLKNADATDVAKQLKDLNPDQDNGSRYPFFFGGGPSQSKNGKKINVVADRRRNAVIVQAPPAVMGEITKMIEALDEAITDDSLAPVIYPLKYVSAADIEDVLNDLFLKKTQAPRPYWWDYENPDQATMPDRDVGRLYGKVRITSEPYSNAIILTSNSKENLEAVISVLKQLDVPSQAGESTFRVGLRFATAADVAKSINILFAKNGSPPLRPVNQQGQQQNQNQNQNQQGQQQGQSSSLSEPDFGLEQETKEEGYFPWLGGQPDNTRPGDTRNTTRPVSDLVGRVRVVPDQRSNSLLISANVHFFPEVMKLIEELDVPTAEVMIEAKVLEISADYLDSLGVRWSPNGAQEFSGTDYDNSLIGSGTGFFQKGFGGLTTVNGGTNALTGALTSLRSGVIGSTINVDLLVQFLKEKTAATVLDQPQMNILDNETGRLFVGQQVPFINNSSAPAVGGLSQSFTYKNVGVVLEVTPHINVTGDVSLKIHVESSEVVAGEIILGGAVINTRAFKTDLTAKTGQTLVLGGIIQKQMTDTLRKTPGLGSVPGLKWLFNKKDKVSNDVELMVFLRPKVVRTPQEAQELLDETDKKAPLVKRWEEGKPPIDIDRKKKSKDATSD